jgi:hypothetical protein
MAELAGLSVGEVAQRVINFIGANLKSGNDLRHVLSGPASVFDLFPSPHGNLPFHTPPATA